MNLDLENPRKATVMKTFKSVKKRRKRRKKVTGKWIEKARCVNAKVCWICT